MNPIIPTWIFYAIEISTGIEQLCFAAMILLGIAFFILTLRWCLDMEYDSEEKSNEKLKNVKKMFIMTLIAGAVAIILPSQKTIYTMVLNSYVTVDNISTAKETLTDAVDYMFEKIEQVR